MTCAGTTIYMAPEVFSGKSYGIEADGINSKIYVQLLMKFCSLVLWHDDD